MHEPLRCDEALDLLEPSLDGELTPGDAARLRAHLFGCPSCTRELALARRIQGELRALPLSEVLPAVPPEVRALAGGGGARALLAAAMLAMTVGGALFLEQARLHPAPPPGPSTADVARATAEARFALAYIGKVSRHAGLDLRDGLRRR
jgi:anti-sigma factor RsiW